MLRDPISEEKHNILRGFEQFEALTELSQHVSDNPEAMAAIAQLSASATGSSQAAMQVLAQESLQSQRLSGLSSIFEYIGQRAQRSIDNYHFLLTLFNAQRSRVHNVTRDVSEVRDNETYRIPVSISKYMRFGKGMDVPKDGAEYVEEFEKLVTTMSHTADFMQRIAKLDNGATFRALWKLISLQIDQHNQQRVSELIDRVDDLVKKTRLKRHHSSTKYMETYASDMLLGGLQLTAHLPVERDLQITDMRTVMESMKNTGVYVYRLDKIRFSSTLDGKQTLEFRGKDLKKLAMLVDQLYSSLDEILSFSVKWSTVFSTTSNAVTLMEREKQSDDYPGMSPFFRFSRVLAKYDAVIYDSVSSTYNASMGNIKKALSILENV